MKRKLFFATLIGLSVFVFMFIVTSTLIGLDVAKRCEIAQEKYGGDCAEALSEFILDEQNSFHSRNSSIWATGQLGDEKVLPALESLYTGNIPEREPYDAGISQYELKKAIKLLKGGTNIAKLVR